jgi:hypothetical protein
VMAKSSGGIEICDGAGVWKTIGGGASAALSSTATCAAPADAGNVRYNSVSGKPEFCDGTAWTPFALSSPTGSLTISPASNYSMDVAGPCAGAACPYAYGSWITFTVSNQGLSATSVLSVPTITGANASNFAIDLAASTCDDGISLAAANAAGNSCIVKVRAVASGNMSYSAQLNVTGGSLNAIAPLYGVGTLFTCGSGSFGWGGIVVGSCTGSGGTVPGTNQLILERAGCGSSTYEPVCTDDPSNDPSFTMGPGLILAEAAQSSSGAVNTASTLAYQRVSPANEYCNSLVKDGYDDWFLPAYVDLQAFYADSVIRTKFLNDWYWSSNYYRYAYSNDYWYRAIPANGSGADATVGENHYVRCARRHNATAPSAVLDNDPVYSIAGNVDGTLTIPGKYTSTLSADVISVQIPVFGFNTPITASVTGSGTPQIRVNGGAWASSLTINPSAANAIVEVKATSPATYGSELVTTVNIGTDTSTFKVRTYDVSVVKNIFVTSTNYNGNMGGLAGANSICRARANFAGLSGSGTYQALIATNGSSALDNIGWNWGTLQTVGVNSVVASSPANLVAGTLSAAPNRTEFGVIKSSNVWGGTGYNYVQPSNIVEYTGESARNCNSWTAGTNSNGGTYGSTGSTNQYFMTADYSAGVSCDTTLPIYCVGPNPDLPNVTCPGAVDVTSTKNTPGSYSVTIPATCEVTFKLWGGAGGADSSCNGQGGGGGYAEYKETPSVATTYYYFVGGKGAQGSNGAGGTSNGGFEGGAGNGANGTGGGGATLLYKGAVNSANLVAVAGGGGGAYNSCSSIGKAGGQSGNTYSSSSTAGVDALGSCVQCGGGGGGYDGSSGGGGVGGAGSSNTVGSGGKNWVTTGSGISSTTSAGSVGMPGNYGDADKPANAGASNYPSSSTGVFSGAVVVKY